MYRSVGDLAKAWVKKLNKLEKSKSNREKFRDFCEMVYCALAQTTEPKPERREALEARYMQIVSTYQDKDTVRAYPELMAMVWEGVGNDLYWDVLGAIAAELETLDAGLGQFFTPMEVSLMLAGMIIGDVTPQIEERGYLTISEPAVGAGGMVLAAAKVFRQKGFNPSIHMLVEAADLSVQAYHMCYIQLTMANIPAVVHRMNTLSMERFETALTIGTHYFYAHHGHLNFEHPNTKTRTEDSGLNNEKQEVIKPEPVGPMAGEPEVKFEQLSLF